MSAARLIIAAIVGGIVVFVWGAVSHMALPLGEMGISSMPAPAEQTALPAMKAAMPQRGFYFFPGMDKTDTSDAATKAWEEKYRQGPRGVVIFDPAGGEMMSMNQLLMEYLSNTIGALLAAIVLAHAPASWLKRTLLGALLGMFAWLSIDVSYWNWYRFPDLFTLAQFIDQTVGWLLGGSAIALVLGRRRAGSPAPTVPAR